MVGRGEEFKYVAQNVFYNETLICNGYLVLMNETLVSEND